MGPDNDVLGLAFAYGKHFLDHKQYQPARYFLEILHDLTHDDEIADMLEAIPVN